MVNFKPVLLFLKIISLFIVQRNFGDILQGNGIEVFKLLAEAILLLIGNMRISHFIETQKKSSTYNNYK